MRLTPFISIAVFVGAVALVSPGVISAAPSVDSNLSRYLESTNARDADSGALHALGEEIARPAAVSEEGGREWVSVLLQGDVDPNAITRLGGHIGTDVGGIITARLPLDAVPGLMALRGVEQIQLAQPVEFYTNVSIPEIGVDEVWDGTPPNYSPSGVTGKDVIIGIADSGLDPFHEDFRTSQNKTRVLWFWDQEYSAVENPPAGFSYGNEYSSSAINAGQYAKGDVLGHGTLLAGIAAANGRATGNGYPAYSYVGVAPEADLVVVTLKANANGLITDDKVIDATNYIFQKASAEGKPAVVLLGLGKMTGPHDGQDPLDQALTALSGPGKLIVAAVGNNNDKALHGELTTTSSNQTKDVTIVIEPYTPSGYGVDYLISEGWYDAGVNYDVSVLTPNGQLVGPIARGQSTQVQTSQGRIQIINGQYTSANGSYRVDLLFDRPGSAYPEIAEGTWKLRFKSRTSGTHRADLWITRYLVGSINPGFAQGMTESRLVSSPSTADGVISVGAYSTKRSWPNVLGGTGAYFSAVVDDIAYFSSPGPRRDGDMAPDVAAPGFGAASSLASNHSPSGLYVTPDGVHMVDRGTSLAAAHVAGMVALMLEEDPSLTPEGVRSELHSSSYTDSYTGATPNSLWGWGKLRAVPQGTTAVIGGQGSRFGLASPFPNPSRGSVTFRFSLSPDDLETGDRGVCLRILDVRGREVSSIHGYATPGQQQLTWNRELSSGKTAPPGLYFGRLEIDGSHATTKFLILP